MYKAKGSMGYEPAVQFEKGVVSDVLMFGNKSGIGEAKDTCGGFSWNAYDKIKTNVKASDVGNSSVVMENLSKLKGFTLGNELSSKIHEAQRAAMIQTAQYFEPYAKHMVETKTIPQGDFIGAAVAEYNRTMDAYYKQITSQSLDKKIDEVNSHMLKDGWLFAGAYFMRFVNMNNELRELAQAQPDDLASNTAAVDAIVAASAAEDLGFLLEYLQERQQKSGDFGVAEAYKNEVSADGSFMSNTIAKLMHGGLVTQDEFVKMMAAKDRHPILTLQNMGNYMIGMYEAAKLIEMGFDTLVPIARAKKVLDGKALQVTQEKQAKYDKIDKARDTAGGVLDWIFGMVMVAALILAIGVPLLPYIIWSIDVLGWLLAVVVSVIAAPVWMVMHMHPEGHEVAGHGAHGYLLLLSVIMKPALMVISLIFAMLLSWVAIDITAQGWSYAFASANAGVVVGPVITIGGMLVFAMVMLLLVYKTFALIHGIQNEVLSWVGGRDQDLVGAGRSAEVMAGMMAAAAMRASGGGSVGSKIAAKKSGREAREGSNAKAAKDHADGHTPNKGIRD
jgi:conjugal transfer/type IV secretion protein DotA/TraY